jgi:hypothetical protein
VRSILRHDDYFFSLFAVNARSCGVKSTRPPGRKGKAKIPMSGARRQIGLAVLAQQAR